MERSLPKQPRDIFTSTSPADRLDLDVLAQLVADGESPIPDDFTPHEQKTFIEKVRSVRRKRLLKVLAGIVAASLEKSFSAGEIATDQKPSKT